MNNSITNIMKICTLVHEIFQSLMSMGQKLKEVCFGWWWWVFVFVWWFHGSSCGNELSWELLPLGKDNSGSLPNTEMNNEKMSLLLPASRHLPSLSSQESGLKFGKDVSPPSPGHTLATLESR